eukprot:1156017-Pelagomonas_calceolata.AAC.3
MHNRYAAYLLPKTCMHDIPTGFMPVHILCSLFFSGHIMHNPQPPTLYWICQLKLPCCINAPLPLRVASPGLRADPGEGIILLNPTPKHLSMALPPPESRITWPLCRPGGRHTRDAAGLAGSLVRRG